MRANAELERLEARATGLMLTGLEVIIILAAYLALAAGAAYYERKSK